ncbi:MAG: T9SS type A sorting domain-containing protein [Ignavibacteria bacterium]|nr:T9SS type A sorting domain-containing protein [Ignavibacteria bacterium]
MKKILLILISIFSIVNCKLLSQNGWLWLSPLPQGNSLSNVSYVDAQTVYVSGNLGTLMKSTDGGNSFDLVPTGLRDNLYVTFINELTGFSSAHNGIFRTQNGGINWQYIPAPVNSIGQVLSTPTTVFYSMSNYNRIFKSTDLGETWNESLIPYINTSLTAFHFADSQTGYATCQRTDHFMAQFYKTSNGGLTWDTIKTIVSRTLGTICFTDSITGYVTTTIPGRILKTTNGCIGWDTVLSTSTSSGSFRFFNQTEGYFRGSSIYQVTTNAGINWSQSNIYSPFFPFDLNQGLGFRSNYLYNLIFKTTNFGQNWTQITTSVVGDFLDVTFINENTGFAVADNRIQKTTNAGIEWVEYYLNLSGFAAVENIMFVNDNTGYAGIDGGRIAKTTNCGINWIVYETGCYDHNHGMSFPSADTGYAVTKYGFYLKTTNGGVTWVNSGQRENQGYGDVCFVNNTTGFAAGDSSLGSLGFGLISVTTNGGESWKISRFDSVEFFYDACIATPTTWFAAGSQYSPTKGVVLRSTDGGVSWGKSYFPSHITAITFPSSMSGYASSHGGLIFKTTNGGDSWFPTECIASSSLDGLFFINDNTGYGVGSGGRIIKTTTGGGNFIGIQPINSSIPKEFKLSQNYPNPFNPNTKIKFQLVKGDHAKLVIYDVLGREISVLVNEELKAGNYEVNWNAANYPSGVYFYRLETGDYSETRKMVLIK